MRRTSLLVSLLFAAACSTPPPAVLRLVAVDGTGAPVTGRDATFDFGLVQRGTERTLPLVVQNAGSTLLTLTGFRFVAGDAVSATPGVEGSSPVFSVDLGPGFLLQPGAQRTYTLRFTPPVDAALGARFASVLVLHATTEAGADEAQLTLSGTAVVDDACALPLAIDFGVAPRGGEVRQGFTLANHGSTPRTVDVGAPQSFDLQYVFFVTEDSPRGLVTLAPGEVRDVTLRFTPAESRAYRGRMPVTLQGCPEQLVTLAGDGVDSVLSCVGSVDFGFALPGAFVDHGLTCENTSFESVELSSMAAFEDGAPAQSFSLPSGETTLTLPPGHRAFDGQVTAGVASVVLRFAPPALGPRSGTFRALVSGAGQQGSVLVALRGVGGGPDVQVSPAPAVDFGEVAYTVGASPPSSARMDLEVRNVGARPNPADARANLKLGVPDGVGGFGKPFWQVTAQNAATQASELCVGLWDAVTGACLDDLARNDYDPRVGLEAAGTSSLLTIPLRVTPSGAGQKAWELQLFTNDPDEPVVTLAVTANVVPSP